MVKEDMENPAHNNSPPNNTQLMTPALDLLAPTDRFLATSKLYVRLHRHQILFRKYWWMLLLVFLLTTVPAYLLTMATPRAFRSEARMWLTGKLDLSEGRLYTEELVNFLGTQADLLRSRAIQERALEKTRQQLTNSPALRPVPGTLDVLRSVVSSSAASSNAATAFPFRLKVAESSKSSILELRATGAEPVSTRIFLNALMTEYLKLYTPQQARRHEAKPGITGLAQIKGRNSLSWDERFALDVWYVDHANLALDLRIVLQTVVNVLRRESVSPDGDLDVPSFTGSLSN